jgi:hypothetical protein
VCGRSVKTKSAEQSAVCCLESARERRDCGWINLFMDLGVFILLFFRRTSVISARVRGVNMKKKFEPRWGIFYVTFYNAGDASGILRRSLSRRRRACVITNNKEIRGFAQNIRRRPPGFFLTHKQTRARQCRQSCFFFVLFFFCSRYCT